MTQHTPGPWIVERENGETHVRTDDIDGWYVATCPEQPGDGDAIDNARLIAAAPDLLAALEAMRYRLIDAIEDSGYSVSGPTNWNAEPGFPKWVASARADLAIAQAAIAQARGIGQNLDVTA